MIEVRQNLHIPMHIQPWDLCTEEITYNIEDDGSQYIYEQLGLKNKYKMLHYSGDIDGAVPTRGTQNWLASTSWTITEPWSVWNYDGQVAGYVTKYDSGLTFATVKGAGHMVPQDKPEESYHLIFNWMFDRDL